MLSRCRNANHQLYEAYGGRGIRVCERWLVYENFLADMGRKPAPDLSIDRINNDGNYEPGNCRWATRVEQNNNTRVAHRNAHPHRQYDALGRPRSTVTVRGSTKTLTEWLSLANLRYTTYWRRTKTGLSPEDVILDALLDAASDGA